MSSFGLLSSPVDSSLSYAFVGSCRFRPKGSKELIDHIRARCAGVVYHNAMSPVVAQQVLTALRIIMGEDGTNIGATKIKTLRDNSNFVRR